MPSFANPYILDASGNYNMQTASGQLVNQGSQNLTDLVNKYANNETIASLGVGSLIDANKTMLNTGTYLAGNQAYLNQTADYLDRRDQSQYGYTSKLMGQEAALSDSLLQRQGAEQRAMASAEGQADVGRIPAQGDESRAGMYTQGSIDLNQLRTQGDQSRANLYAQGAVDVGNIRATGAENRSNLYAQGTVDLGNIRTKGTEDRANLYAQGAVDVGNIRAQGLADQGKIRTQGAEDRASRFTQGIVDVGNIRAQGAEDRAGRFTQGIVDLGNIRAQGSEDRASRLTQGLVDIGNIQAQGGVDLRKIGETGRWNIALSETDARGRDSNIRTQGEQDRARVQEEARQQRNLRADARGAIRSQGARFFG